MKEDPLPPLLTLRVLEACLRHGSFSRAAEELGVTPGAVTQQIRVVETWVGTPLFRRTGRNVEPNEASLKALPELQDGFSSLHAAARILKSPHRRDRIVSISVPPSFASKWLLPRIEEFRQEHPGIDVWVSAEMDLVDFTTGDTDVAIRYGAGRYDGLTVKQLFAETVVPVAAPSLMERAGPFDTPRDVLKATLLHDANPENDASCPDWSMWLKARGVNASGVPGPRFNQSSMVIEQAVEGRGIALAKKAIAAADIAAGRLAPIFDDVVPLAFSYWIVWPRGRTLQAPARAFIAWLEAQQVDARSAS